MNDALLPLLLPLAVRSKLLRNRVVMPPMTRGFSPNGVPGEDVRAYYQRRAESGVGLIVTEATAIDHPSAVGDAGFNERNVPHMFGNDALAGWRRVVEAVHAAGGAIYPQLWHQGPMRVAGTGPFASEPSCRPSGIWGVPGRRNSLAPDYVTKMLVPTTPMRDSDIQEVIDSFARSAANAKACGFDGIALLGAHGYLIDSFLWADTNQRTDRWGGSIAARSTFAIEVVRAVRKAVGDAMPIVFRFSQWKQQDFDAKLAQTPEELEQVLGPIGDAGVDIFDASTPYFSVPPFSGSDLTLAGWAKKLTGKQAMAVGRVGPGLDVKAPFSAGSASERIRRNEFDLVGIGRPLLVDPDWMKKVAAGAKPREYERTALDSLF